MECYSNNLYMYIFHIDRFFLSDVYTVFFLIYCTRTQHRNNDIHLKKRKTTHTLTNKRKSIKTKQSFE